MDEEVARVAPRSAEAVVAKAHVELLVQLEDQPTCERMPLTRKDVAMSMSFWWYVVDVS